MDALPSLLAQNLTKIKPILISFQIWWAFNWISFFNYCWPFYIKC